ncbi:MAG TPA: bifunctional UDP-N-acetylmuramoyl-tripeptide:D-alanyl-D-alanine ligase/alanine racemase [Bacteroidales bacterium]|nr:bifunctional UDP-N-acetylmuramoyl-tripeptide:D-alanyl-D-alanine ligase/alanine racemase [Bacteroidales bacterium]
MSLITKDIARITGGILFGKSDLEVCEIILDSRRASFSDSEAAFFALSGNVRNGHDFIENAYRGGIRIFVVEKKYSLNLTDRFPDATFIKVEDTLKSLHKLTSYKRDIFDGVVISITGSNGKTIVKEWLAEILGKIAPVIRSPRSYNSQTGVPLSIWKLDNSYRYGVIEAGMSVRGEIEKLEKIIRPHIGIFTNIGEAHQENFPDIETKTREKLALFKDSNTIIYSLDHPLVNSTIRSDSRMRGKRFFTWSEKDQSADLLVKKISSSTNGALLSFRAANYSFKANIPFNDRASFENVASVVSALSFLEVDPEVIIANLKDLCPVAMRMEQKEGINGCILIEDYYNSDPVSLSLALEHLKNQPLNNKTLIISDFVQSNRDKRDLYNEVARLSGKAGVKRFIGIGREITSCLDLFPDDSIFFNSTNEMKSWLSPSSFKNEAILIKGARLFQLEEIGQLLERTIHQTQLEVNLNSILHNLNVFKAKLPRDTRIMAMVKAFAYGAGSKDIAEWLNYNGIDYLAVAYTDEGINLRQNGVTNRIMVMSPEPYSFRLMIGNDLEPELYSLEILSQFISEAERNGLINYPVHIKLDTGMHRLGIMEEEIEEASRIISSSASIRVASVFTHLASSEDSSHDVLTEEQVARFTNMSNSLELLYGKGFIRHVLNTAGIIRFPHYVFDMVRIGIGLYGIPGTLDPALKPAVTFTTRIIQIKEVKAGEGIGYGFTDSSDKPRKVATVPVGYADGLSRKFGQGRGRMYLNGSYVQIVGTICMDMCMLDITDIDASPGDQVEVFGEKITVEEMAQLCETIPYEILTAIPSRVKRVYYYE